jgi:TPR repeat protein
VRVLAGGADGRAAADAREPPDQMPLPTLDERANFYLRAVYGEREFTNEDYWRARNLILNAMAADIAAGSGARTPEGAWLPAQFPAGDDHEHLSASVDASFTIAALESSDEPGPVRSANGAAFGEHHAPRAVEDSREAALALPRGSQGFPHIRLPPVFSGRAARRTAAACAATAFAAAAVLWLVGIFPTAWLAPPSRDSRVAVQASPPEPSGRTPPGSRVMAEAEREVASALNAAQRRPDEVAALLKRGQELIADGKFRLARLVLEQAAEAGSAPAALALGRTYDPIPPERPSVRSDAASDIAMARVWYQKAKDLGSAEAARRLGQLSAPVPSPAAQSGPK